MAGSVDDTQPAEEGQDLPSSGVARSCPARGSGTGSGAPPRASVRRLCEREPQRQLDPSRSAGWMSTSTSSRPRTSSLTPPMWSGCPWVQMIRSSSSIERPMPRRWRSSIRRDPTIPASDEREALPGDQEGVRPAHLDLMNAFGDLHGRRLYGSSGRDSAGLGIGQASPLREIRLLGLYSQARCSVPVPPGGLQRARGPSSRAARRAHHSARTGDPGTLR